jgi:hypothetical protein
LNDYSIVGQSLPPTHAEIAQARRYLVVPSDGEGTVLQLFTWKVCQDIGNKSRNIRSGGEGNLLVAVTTNGYFPARDIKVEDPLNLSLDGRNSQKQGVYQETYDAQM